jgi:hypothetical protein
MGPWDGPEAVKKREMSSPAGNRTLLIQPIAHGDPQRQVKVEFGYRAYFASVLNWKTISQISLSWYTILLFVTFRHFNLHLTFETSFWNDWEENTAQDRETQQLTWTKSKVITLVVRRRGMGGGSSLHLMICARTVPTTLWRKRSAIGCCFPTTPVRGRFHGEECAANAQ